MKRIGAINYVRPTTISEASEYLKKERSAGLAGGTDLIVALREKGLELDYVVDLKFIPGLSDLVVRPGEGLEIGAMTSVHRIEISPELLKYYPSFPEAAEQLGSDEVRRRATIGGNLCSALPSAELSPNVLVLDGTLTLSDGTNERKMKAEDFFISAGKSALQPGELLVKIEFPWLDDNMAAAYEKFGPRNAMDIAIVNAASFLHVNEDGVCEEARIGLGVVAPTTKRARCAEEFLQGKVINKETIEEAARISSQEDAKTCRTSRRASAEYRKDLVYVLTMRTLEKAYERILAKRGQTR